jgi:hypothetical protein
LLIIGLKKPTRMIPKKRMKINKRILNQITMQLPLALMASVECTSSLVEIMLTQTSSKRAKILI